jgi:hypothetical protein
MVPEHQQNILRRMSDESIEEQLPISPRKTLRKNVTEMPQKKSDKKKKNRKAEELPDGIFF